MRSKIVLALSLFLATGFTACDYAPAPTEETRLAKAEIGKEIFFDISLSNPAGQSCASCHAASAGFSDPNHAAVSPGVQPHYFGYRNAPSIGYASYTPSLHYSTSDSTWVGGLFLDGRANDLTSQAMQPFLNPLEMNDRDASMVAEHLRAAPYYGEFKRVFGESASEDTVFHQIAEALAAYEGSPEMHAFTSKFDYYLRGRVHLSDEEMRGYRLFTDASRAKCANCHTADADGMTGKVLFTDFTYDNLGVPRNPKNPYYFMPPTRNPHGEDFIDDGLARTIHTPETRGQFKVPSLRNVAVSAPYFHNGCFSDLKEVVHWYSVRESATRAGGYAGAEVSENVNHEELGDLHLSARDEDDIVAFLKTLTDGYK